MSLEQEKLLLLLYTGKGILTEINTIDQWAWQTILSTTWTIIVTGWIICKQYYR